MKKTQSAIIISAILTSLFTHSVIAQQQLEGTVKDVGFGKYAILDSTKTEFLLHASKRETQYEPALWRPAAGDKVSADYYERKDRNGDLLVAKSISLVKAGPDSVTISSPVTAIITETGRSGFITTLPDYGDKDLKFSRGRSTKLVPAGWVPGVGEKASITFHLQEATFGFGIAYIADEVKKME
jgi:hypothetical protein